MLAARIESGVAVQGSLADDGALRALFWPFETGTLHVPASPVLFFGARAGAWIGAQATERWQCEQPFAPWAEALRQQRITVQPRLDAESAATTLLLPPRQRDEARSLLARALRSTAIGGLLVAAAGNNDGARSLESDLRALAGAVHSQSKHKSRVLWTRVDHGTIDRALMDEWLSLDEPRRLGEGDAAFWTRPGLFAWDRVDPASALLASQLPATLGGRVADLGAGWGYLTMHLLRQCPGITAIDLYEANARALDPARRNLADLLAGRTSPACEVQWHDVATGLPRRYDAIVSNPPFHIGRADAPQLGRAFIDSAAAALEADGQAWIVANRHLPYEALLGERFRIVSTPVQRDGFKVLHARQPKT